MRGRNVEANFTFATIQTKGYRSLKAPCWVCLSGEYLTIQIGNRDKPGKP